MRKQYLHLSVYLCDKCHGPVVAGTVAIRENDISKETELTHVGAICLSCGHRHTIVGDTGIARQLPPIEWHSEKLIEGVHLKVAFGEMLGRAI
jgi:hypothetical protein